MNFVCCGHMINDLCDRCKRVYSLPRSGAQPALVCNVDCLLLLSQTSSSTLRHSLPLKQPLLHLSDLSPSLQGYVSLHGMLGRSRTSPHTLHTCFLRASSTYSQSLRAGTRNLTMFRFSV